MFIYKLSLFLVVSSIMIINLYKNAGYLSLKLQQNFIKLSKNDPNNVDFTGKWMGYIFRALVYWFGFMFIVLTYSALFTK